MSQESNAESVEARVVEIEVGYECWREMSFVLEVTGLTTMVREDRREERRDVSVAEAWGEAGGLRRRVCAVFRRLSSAVSGMS